MTSWKKLEGEKDVFNKKSLRSIFTIAVVSQYDFGVKKKIITGCFSR